MKHYLLFYLTLFSNLFLYGQQEPLLIAEGDQPIEISSVDVDIKVLENIAFTTTEITFFNPNDEVLEGELNFPLGAGQSIFRFAMSINGSIRESVAIEKAKGTQAFEGVIRQQIDPALLEKTVGDNYKARVYPIPANGYKSVIIGVEEQIDTYKHSYYENTLNYGYTDSFKLDIKLVNQRQTPIIKQKGLGKIRFNERNGSQIASLESTTSIIVGYLKFSIPNSTSKSAFRQKTDSIDYIYAVAYPKLKNKKRRRAKSVTVVWDSSHSSEFKNHELELDFLTSYLKKIKINNVDLILFNNSHHVLRSINRNELKEIISDFPKDGSTNFNAIPFHKIKTEEIILFSDGIHNSTNYENVHSKIPIHTITSSLTKNSELLNNLSFASGGHHIDLTELKKSEALKKILERQYQFLGVKNVQKGTEIYPKTRQVIDNNKALSISAKTRTNKQQDLILLFGYDGKVQKRIKVTIPEEDSELDLKRIWAKKKVADLSVNPDKNREAIILIGKKYTLVTPFTSLIILDRVEDYVEYEIFPPKELEDEYFAILKEKSQEKESTLTEIYEILYDENQNRIDWWKNNVIDTNKEEKKRSTTNPTIPQPEPQSNSLEENAHTPRINTQQNNESQILENSQTNYPPPNTIQVLGSVVDESGLPIIAATVRVVGSENAAITDIDGLFTLQIKPDDKLVISTIGYEPKELINVSGGTLTIELKEAVSSLDDVVVVGYSASENKHLNASVVQVLQGRALGISVTSIPGGNNSINVGPNPMYIIDGVISQKDDFTSLNSDDLVSINVLKEAAANNLFGNKANDGVIVITTILRPDDDTYTDSLIQYFKPEFRVDPWEPDEPYMDIIKETDLDVQYDKYIELKNEYGFSPSFYLAIGTYFINTDRKDIGIKVISNIAELELENHELMKILARQYLKLDLFEEAIYLYKKIEELRPQEPHSKRDLALAYNKKGDHKKAIELLSDILSNSVNMEDWDERFPLIKNIVLQEFNTIRSQNNIEENFGIPDSLLSHTPMDLRIVLDWNSLETDMDLHVIEPNGETCSYKNDLTSIGGRLTEDYMDGYGPEEYLLKNAIAGEYKIQVDYFDDRVQKISGPVTIEVSVFSNYGRKNQKIQSFTLQLDKEEDTIDVGTFIWNE